MCDVVNWVNGSDKFVVAIQNGGDNVIFGGWFLCGTKKAYKDNDNPVFRDQTNGPATV